MYIGQVIEELIRPRTGNTTHSVDSTSGATTEGISDTLILSYINDALQFLQSRIIAVYPNEFVTEYAQNTVASQEEYSIVGNVFLNNKWVSVDFSYTGNLDDYHPLPPASLQQRDTREGTVYQHIRRNGKVLLNRIPKDTRGKLRVNFYEALDTLDIRRGQITSVNSTTIVFDADDWLDDFALSDAQYFCIVDKYGEVQTYNIPITSYTTSTRTLVYPSQTVVGAAGDYVVVGKYKSTHLTGDKSDHIYSRMLTFCKLVAQARIFAQDSSTDEVSQIKEVADVLTDIIDSFAELTETVMDVPNIDDSTYYE